MAFQIRTCGKEEAAPDAGKLGRKNEPLNCSIDRGAMRRPK